MNNVIFLSMSGNLFLFEDNNFTADQEVTLQGLAQNICKRFPDVKDPHEICKRFTTIVQDELEIVLREVKVSFVLRTNLSFV